MDALGLFAFVISAANLALLGGLAFFLHNSSDVRVEVAPGARLAASSHSTEGNAPSVLVPVGRVRVTFEAGGKARHVEARFELVFPLAAGDEAVRREGDIRKAVEDVLRGRGIASLEMASERGSLRTALLTAVNRVLKRSKANSLFLTELHFT